MTRTKANSILAVRDRIMSDVDQLRHKARQFDTAGKAALLIGIVALPFTGGKGDSLFLGFFLFLVLKAISEWYRKKGLAQAASGAAEKERT
jgi:hypothetical protein